MLPDIERTIDLKHATAQLATDFSQRYWPTLKLLLEDLQSIPR